MSYQNHPAADLFPMMGNDELGKLADDIAANGLLERIVLHDGMILDGRNRYAACILADVEPQFQNPQPPPTSPVIYVLSKNLHRRHLTLSQRAAIAADVVPMLAEEAHQRQWSGSQVPLAQTCAKGKSSALAAAELQVGERSVQKALAVKRDYPEAFERVKRGEITVHEAEGQRKRRQRERAEDGNEPIQPVGVRAKTSKAERIEMIRGLAAEGCCSTQIAAEIGYSDNYVRDIANKSGIKLPHVFLGKSHHININRVMEETIAAAQGMSSTVDLLEGRTNDLDSTKIDEWIAYLSEARATIKNIVKILRGLQNERQDSEEVQQQASHATQS